MSAPEMLGAFDLAICSLCSGALRFLGALGDTLWYRCESCGAERGRAADLEQTRKAIKRACERSERGAL